MDEAIARAARNQALFREINEATEPMKETAADITPYAEWLCECANGDCLERISMTTGEYRTLRETPTHFAVAPGDQHVIPNIERIVDKTDRYWIVEKLGAAAEIVQQLDADRELADIENNGNIR